MARYLADGIGRMDAFELWNDDLDIPVFAWQLADGHTKNWSLFDLQDRLRMRGWLVPAYPMPALADVTVQRIVVRTGSRATSRPTCSTTSAPRSRTWTG